MRSVTTWRRAGLCADSRLGAPLDRAALLSADRDQKRKIGIGLLQLGPAQLLAGQPGEKRNRRQHIAAGFDVYIFLFERLSEKQRTAGGREAPVFGVEGS